MTAGKAPSFLCMAHLGYRYKGPGPSPTPEPSMAPTDSIPAQIPGPEPGPPCAGSPLEPTDTMELSLERPQLTWTSPVSKQGPYPIL